MTSSSVKERKRQWWINHPEHMARNLKLNEYTRKTRRNRWLSENGPCKGCGSWSELEVDHVDPNTKVDHKVWLWKESRRLEELKKCQVLCTTCHKLKSNLENSERSKKRHSNGCLLQHGTRLGYTYYKCRCVLCKGAHADYMKEYRANK